MAERLKQQIQGRLLPVAALVVALWLVTPAAFAHEPHRVSSGETLTQIASDHGSSVSGIVAANDIADADLVLAGEELVIPRGATADGISSETAASSISGIILAAAADYGVDGSYLVAIARCESGLNPNAVSPAGYYGLFQYSPSTWAHYGSGSIYDPVAQARTTAGLIAAGGSSHWPNCA